MFFKGETGLTYSCRKLVRVGVLRCRDLVLSGMLKLEHTECIAYGRFSGGDSDAKSEFFQFSLFFFKILFRMGEGCHAFLKSPRKGPFRKVWVMGRVGDHIFSLWVTELGHFGTWALRHLLVNLGRHCMQGFQGARPGAPTCRSNCEKLPHANLCVLMC